MAMSSDVYCAEITEEETAAGFQIMNVPNPKGFYAFELKTVPAVVRMLSTPQRLIKIINPMDNTVFYAHQAYIEGKSGNDKWGPVTDAAYSVEMAAKRLPISEEEIMKKYGWTKTLR